MLSAIYEMMLHIAVERILFLVIFCLICSDIGGVYANNTSSVISSLSQTTLGVGVNIDTSNSYIEKQASISSKVVCDSQIQATKSSTVGFVSYPSVTVGY